MVMDAAPRLVAPRAMWLALLAGPVAWILDEGISLLIEADVCSRAAAPGATAVRLALIVVGVVALGVMGIGVRSAMKSLRFLESGQRAVAVERLRFLAIATLLLAAVCAFGVTLRVVAAVVGSVCG